MLRFPVDMQSKSSEVLVLHSYWQHSTASCRLEPGMSIVFNIYIMFLFLLYLDTGFSFPNCSCSQFLEFEWIPSSHRECVDSVCGARWDAGYNTPHAQFGSLVRLSSTTCQWQTGQTQPLCAVHVFGTPHTHFSLQQPIHKLFNFEEDGPKLTVTSITDVP